jgi:Protein of unknown function (DUF998)
MIRQPAFATAIATAIIILLMSLLGGIATPGYSHVSQFISELGASQAAYEYPVRFMGFLPAGVTLLAFCWVAQRSVPRSPLTSVAFLALAVYAAGYCVATVFPCDPGCRPHSPSLSQVVHNVAGGVGYLVAPAFLCIFGFQSRSWPAAARLPFIGFIAAFIALAGLLTLSPSSPYVGVSQRAIEVSVLGWVVACGWYIRVRSRVAVS